MLDHERGGLGLPSTEADQSLTGSSDPDGRGGMTGIPGKPPAVACKSVATDGGYQESQLFRVSKNVGLVMWPHFADSLLAVKWQRTHCDSYWTAVLFI